MQSVSQVKDDGQLSTAGQRYAIGIVGAGNIGCYLGAYLCQDAALHVKFFGRETTALELAAHGLSVTSYHHQSYFTQQIAFYSSLNSLIECDLVLLTVKATALVPMLAQLQRFVRPDVPIVALQSGIGIGEMLSQDLANPVLRALVTFNVVKVRAGQFHRASVGNIIWQRSNFNVVNYVINTFNRLQLGVDVCDDILPAEYGTLLLNLNNAINVISNLPLQQQLLDAGYRDVLAKAMQEWLTVCQKAGVKPHAYTRLPNRLLPWLLRLPDLMFSWLAKSILPIDATAHSSMWDDIQAKKRTEILFLNGAVVRMAQRYNLPAPVNSLLTEQVKLLEAGSANALSAAELLRRAKPSS